MKTFIFVFLEVMIFLSGMVFCIKIKLESDEHREAYIALFLALFFAAKLKEMAK